MLLRVLAIRGLLVAAALLVFTLATSASVECASVLWSWGVTTNGPVLAL